MDNEAKGVTSADAKLGAHVVLPEPEPELIELVREQLDLSPTEILQTLLGNCWPGCRDGLRAAYETGDLAVVVGPVAAASGAPERPGSGRVDRSYRQNNTRNWSSGCGAPTRGPTGSNKRRTAASAASAGRPARGSSRCALRQLESRTSLPCVTVATLSGLLGMTPVVCVSPRWRIFSIWLSTRRGPRTLCTVPGCTLCWHPGATRR